jgi:hypothetical protein
MEEFENTALWKSFYAAANDGERVLVRNLVQKASSRLDLVRDTFPTYTLHNHVHALNVTHRMGDLLGDRVRGLSALEGALLVLSAYLHDIGMVFTPEERADLKSEQEFGAFLNTYPEAFVKLQESGSVTDDIAEWYCRWIHPKRVHRYLGTLKQEETRWGNVSLDRNLGLLCESHGRDTGSLLSDQGLRTDFLGEADLLFCALVLRLADILDFDNSRTPDEVYKYLGLPEHNTRRKTQSDVEWRKHLCSDGFRFPPGGARAERYVLPLIAGPDHPAVEHDIRQFLDVIENEINKCQSLLRHVSDKWRDFRLPLRVNRDNIISTGYKYGEYRFTLEQDQILNLLMGENLYADPYVCVRELVQNAIDTVRHRVFYEHSKGNRDYVPQPIRLATWLDEKGFQWVRIDDRGMGMNEELIINYLLKVGKSYYRSAEFQAEILRYQARQKFDFLPISRFGIGMLSCFIVADQLELSTKRVADQAYDARALRISMTGIRSFYTLHVEEAGHRAPPMPGPQRADETYRKGDDYGTSIAMRLDPRRDHSRFDLMATLRRYVVCPPVPVECEGQRVGGDYEALIECPWLQPVEEPLTPAEVAQVEKTLRIKLSETPRVRLLPLSLTEHSPDPNLRGQAVVGYVALAAADRPKLSQGADSEQRALALELDKGARLAVTLEYENRRKLELLEIRDRQQRLGLDEIEALARELDAVRDGLGRLFYWGVRRLVENRELGRRWVEFEAAVSSAADPGGVVARARELRQRYLEFLNKPRAANVSTAEYHALLDDIKQKAGPVVARELDGHLRDVVETSPGPRVHGPQVPPAHDLARWVTMIEVMDAALGTRLQDFLHRLTEDIESRQESEKLRYKVELLRLELDDKVQRGSGEPYYQAMMSLADLARENRDWRRFIEGANRDGNPSSRLDSLLRQAEILHAKWTAGVGDWIDSDREKEDARRAARLDLTRTPNRLAPREQALFKAMASANRPWLSHNGIFVPDTSGDKTVRILEPIPSGWIRCNIALRDSLRPDVSLSRDELKNLSWSIYSSLNLAFVRALRQHAVESELRDALVPFTGIVGHEELLLGRILYDPNIGVDGLWAGEPIIATKSGHMSLVQIREGLRGGTRFELTGLPDIRDAYRGEGSFLDFCAAAMIQVGLNVRFVAKEGVFVVDTDDPVIVTDGQKLFPPLFFVPYEGSDVLRFEPNPQWLSTPRMPLNLNHPFSQWLIRHAESLRESIPGLLENLRMMLSSYRRHDYDRGIDLAEAVDVINSGLARLRVGHHAFAPTESLTLRPEDFGVAPKK